MIGDIMLLIPGLMSTNAIRDVLIGDTLSGIIRLIAALLLAAALALGFMGAIILFGRFGSFWEKNSGEMFFFRL